MGWRKTQGNIARAVSAVLAVVGSAAAPLFAHAAVVFSPNPLFSVDNALAGDGASGTVIVTNPTQEPVGVWLSVVGGTSTRNLADALVWTVKEGENTVYGPESFGLWLDEAPRFLATLGPLEEKTFLLSLNLPSGAPSAVAGGSVAFAVCVGVGEGDAACSGSGSIPPETPEEDEGSPGDGAAPSSAGGGGGGPPSAAEPLLIFNLAGRALGGTEGSNALEIVWETNRPASSYVVFGPVSGGPYSLNLTLPNFGYPSATAEDLTPRTRHRVLLTNLSPGAYEARAVSRELGAPSTVSRPVVGVVFAESETGGEGAPQQTVTTPGGTAGTGGAASGGALQGGIGNTEGATGGFGAENPPTPFEEGAQSGDGAEGLAAALGILQFDECVVSWIAVALAALLLMGWGASVAGVRGVGFLLAPPVKIGASVVLALSGIAALVVHIPNAALVLLWATAMSGLLWRLPIIIEPKQWFSSALLISSALWFAWAIAMIWGADGWLAEWWCHPTEPLALAGASFLAFGFARFPLLSRS